MKIVRQIIALIFALVVILLLPIAVWLQGMNSALSADTFKNGLASQNIYDDITTFALPVLFEESNIAARALLIEIRSVLSDAEWREITDILLPPDWLRQQTEFLIDSLFNWISGDVEALNAAFDMSAMAARLTGDEGRQAIEVVLAAAPACTDSQIDTLDSIADGAQITPPICQPPEAYLTIAREAMIETLNRTALALTENPPTVARFTSIAESSPESVTNVPIVVTAYNQLTLVFYLCPAAIMALIVTLVVRSFRGFSRWMGLVGIVIALITFMPLLSNPASAIISEFTADITTRQDDAEIQLFQIRLVTGLVNAAFEQFNAPIAAQALLILLVSVGLLAASTFVSERQLQSEISTLTLQQNTSTASVRRSDQLIITHDNDEDDV